MLTEQELLVLDKLTEAWNEYLKLPIQHPDHQTEFRHTFHELQRMVMVRPVQREYGWTKPVLVSRDEVIEQIHSAFTHCPVCAKTDLVVEDTADLKTDPQRWFAYLCCYDCDWVSENWEYTLDDTEEQ